MSIRTKLHPMGGRSSKKSKAYLLMGNSVIDVATLGFTENIDPDTTRGTNDSSVPCNYVILNGKLLFYYSDYYNEETGLYQVGSLTNWTKVSGNSGTDGYAYGIAGGKLYKISGATATQVGSLTTWTDISGHGADRLRYAYGIAGGKLYKISDTTATQVGSLTNWTKVSGYSYSYSGSYTYAYGIAGGKLYMLDGSTTRQINPTSITWTKVSGFSGSARTYGIAGGKLYMLSSSVSNQVGSLTTWTSISGYNSGTSIYAYGIAGGKLYKISDTTATQVGSLTTWTSISGYNAANTAFAYGIADGKLYKIQGTTATQQQVPKCIAVYGCSNQTNPALAVCSG